MRRSFYSLAKAIAYYNECAAEGVEADFFRYRDVYVVRVVL